MLTALNAKLVDMMGPLGPLIALGLAGLLLILVALPTMMNKQRDRFSELKSEARTGKPEDRTLRRDTGGRAEKLERFAHFLEPQKAEEMSSIRLKLLRAGYPDKSAVHMYHAAKMVFGLGALALGILYALLKSANEEVTTQSMIIYTLLPGALGYYLPQYWVNKRMTQRQNEITEGFPDALDMMLVCVEAGQSLDQAILRVAKESRAGHPALADEFDLISNEVKAGKERVTVLKDMSDRVGLPDVASFVTTLVQSATFGTSIADALRVYSADMRDKRVMRAEEKANLLPTKLTLGTMLFTVPPLLVILIGPSVHGIATMMGAMVGN
ncbi:type II secretion system F family protein [Xinfangfangia sp. CPCC 101601]|uniref:Type II secretion system F family protein n=1 Tax=Pseudogemmobacter lacusdianii TaxID=3069608 RepID=A0ABU0VUF0_9RHOB|nr:type II secretion system F family protein [Xinfangfangia sp. CPCC 101601]MDQ2064885.1 type II secretion system F family protein [Xinfangfangia sp. CPCC 101601]